MDLHKPIVQMKIKTGRNAPQLGSEGTHSNIQQDGPSHGRKMEVNK